MTSFEKQKQPPIQALYGLDESQIDFDSFEKPVHAGMCEALCDLKSRAAAAGYCLSLASGYRSFDQQLYIWNAKASGQRPVLDSDERTLDTSNLSELELVHAILRWSALPGASRHHWGSEVDIFDESALDPNVSLQLTCSETQAGGVFENFYCWLELELEKLSGTFFRPYALDLGGVAPEPWHLSYRPVAEHHQAQHTPTELREILEKSDFLLKRTVLENLDEIYQRYFLMISGK